MSYKKNITFFLLLLSTNACLSSSSEDISGTLFGNSFFRPRSASVNAARDLIGTHRFINLYQPQNNFYGAFTVTPEYSQAYKTYQIAESFFSKSNLSISGSNVAHRSANDLLADYFGLSTTFQSDVTLKPFFQNTLIDFAFYGGWGPFYIRVHAPYVWNKAGITLEESVVQSGIETPYPANYMSQDSISAPAQTFTEAMSGDFTWGDIGTPLNFGKISQKSIGIQKLSAVECAVGYNFLWNEKNVTGLSFRFTIPTGNRSTAEYLFEPMIGDSKEWQLGFGINSRWLLWEKDIDQKGYIFFNINALHLLSSKQKRSFDLITPNGFGSRYVLAKEFNNGIYTRDTQPLINFTTLDCDVHIAIQVDFILLFTLLHKNYTFDIGYEGWIRSSEGITLKETINQNKYGLKGIANVTDTNGASNSTQSSATIYGSPLSEQQDVIDANPPVFITPATIDIRSGASSRQLSHKIVTYGGYTWEINDHFKPYTGVGFSVEFEGNRPKNVQPNKKSMSMWTIDFKVGTGF